MSAYSWLEDWTSLLLRDQDIFNFWMSKNCVNYRYFMTWTFWKVTCFVSWKCSCFVVLILGQEDEHLISGASWPMYIFATSWPVARKCVFSVPTLNSISCSVEGGRNNNLQHTLWSYIRFWHISFSQYPLSNSCCCLARNEKLTCYHFLERKQQKRPFCVAARRHVNWSGFWVTLVYEQCCGRALGRQV